MLRSLTIGEIAEALGLSKRGAEMRAARENWPYTVGTGTGRPRLYSYAGLPQEARVALASRELAAVDVPIAIAAAAEAEPEAERLTGAAAEARDARLAIVAALDRFTAATGLSRSQADALFCAAYEAGTAEVAPWVRAAVPSISRPTLFRWRAARAAGATHRLAVDKGAARRGRGVLDIANDGAVKQLILAAMAKQPHLSADHLRALTADRFGRVLIVGEEAAPVPSVRTFQIALKSWRETYRAELLALTNPDAFKHRLRVSGRRSHLVSRPNELWMIDASPADVLTRDGRHSIYVAIDVFTRRLIITVSKTPRASAVGLLLRRAIIEWGVPERIKTDNGSDFVAKYTQRVMAALGIEIDPAAPFAPEQKGVVERAIGTVQRGLMATLPGFIGHSVADRKAIEGRKAFAQRLGRSEDAAFGVDLTPAELQRYCDEWSAGAYAHRPHHGLAGATPFQVAAASTDAIRRVEIRALDMLLAPVAGKDGLRTVGKEGARIDGTLYIPFGVMPGTDVLVRQDPADMGRVYLFDRAGENYLGEAVAPELAGIDPAAAIARAQAAQKAHMAAGVAELKKAKFKPRDFVDAVVRQGAIDAGKLVEFPKREITHTTAAIEAAMEAVAPPAPRPTLSDEVLELHRQLNAADNVTPIRAEETAHQRWSRAMGVVERMRAGTASPDELMWFRNYRLGPEFIGFASTYDFTFEEKSPAEAGR